MRKAIFKFHLWSGLAVAVFLAIAAGTGIILAFRHQLDPALNPQLLTVRPGGQRVSLDEIAGAAIRANPSQTPQWIEIHPDATAAVQVRFLNKDEVYVDPYRGVVLGARNQNDSFVYRVEKLHRYLFLGDVGEVITGVVAVLLVFILGSGIYLWVPKTRAQWRAAIAFDRRLKGRAWSVNLHKVIGIYAAAVLLVLALSGTALALEPVFQKQHDQPVSKRAAKKGAATKPAVRMPAKSYDDLWRKVQPSVGEFQWIRFGFPQGRNAVVRVTYISARNHSNALSYLYLSGRTGDVVRTDLYEQQSGPYRFYLWLTPLHAGEIGGLVWRLVTVGGALALLALLATGTWMYYRRKWVPARRANGYVVSKPGGILGGNPNTGEVTS